MDRLNYFSPYQSKGSWHEDQLTRAFLVVVRMVPLAFSAFLDLVRDGQLARTSAWPLPSTTELLTSEIEIQTQKNSVPQTTGRLVSIIMTDEAWKPEGVVTNSSRGARYDGIISFDPLWIIVIENKPSSDNIWEEQANPNLPEGHQIEIDGKLVVLRWRNVVERLTALLAGKLLHGAECMIVDDFLQFVVADFPYLNPYDTFGQCKNSRQLLERRCRNVLESVASGRVAWQPKWGTYYILLNQPSPVKMCGLYPEGEADEIHQIRLAIYPGDSMVQARSFFAHARRDSTDALLALRDQGWTISPNFHFGFIRRGFGHGVHTSLTLEEYIRHWTDRPIEQLSLDERTFETVLNAFAGSGMIDGSDIPSVLAGLPPSARTVNVIPGIEVVFDWPLNQAVELDRKGGMVEEFKRKANEALVACGCEPFGSSAAAGV